jgi:hypothetical protein
MGDSRASEEEKIAEFPIHMGEIHEVIDDANQWRG